MKILIDTNAYSALMRGDKKIAELLDAAEIVYLSVVVIAELLTGFKGGNQASHNRQLLHNFIKDGGKTFVLAASFATAERFAHIKDNLRKKGTPIPTNDIWIAAQCMEVGAILLSADSHFSNIESILVWSPVQ